MINRSPCFKNPKQLKLPKIQEARYTRATRHKMRESMLEMRHLSESQGARVPLRYEISELQEQVGHEECRA